MAFILFLQYSVIVCYCKAGKAAVIVLDHISFHHADVISICCPAEIADGFLAPYSKFLNAICNGSSIFTFCVSVFVGMCVFSESLRGMCLKAATDPLWKGQARVPTDRARP